MAYKKGETYLHILQSGSVSQFGPLVSVDSKLCWTSLRHYRTPTVLKIRDLHVLARAVQVMNYLEGGSGRFHPNAASRLQDRTVS
jgi:hypothetical protein